MAKRHFWESKQEFEKRAKQEFLETASGEKKSFFESQDSYERRAERKALERTSGEKKQIFESEGEWFSPIIWC